MGTIRALRKLGWSDGVEERPVGFAGVEECPDPVVVEPAESESDALQIITASVGPLVTRA